MKIVFVTTNNCLKHLNMKSKNRINKKFLISLKMFS